MITSSSSSSDGNNNIMMPSSSFTEVTFHQSSDLSMDTCSSTAYNSTTTATTTTFNAGTTTNIHRYMIESIPNSSFHSSQQNHHHNYIVLGFTKLDKNEETTAAAAAAISTDIALTSHHNNESSTSASYTTTNAKAFTSSFYNGNRFIRTTLSKSSGGINNDYSSSNNNTMCISGIVNNCIYQPFEVQIDFNNLIRDGNREGLDFIHTNIFYVNKVDEGESTTTSNESGEMLPFWKIICVDSKANLIELHLNYDTLQPFQVKFISSPIDFGTANATSTSTSTSPSQQNKLSKSQITFTSHNQLIFIHPKTQQIVNYHIPSKTFNIWKSFDQCLETKKKSLGYFTCAKGLLMGKTALDLVVSDNDVDGDDSELPSNDGDSMKVDGIDVGGDDGSIPPTIALCNMNELQTKNDNGYNNDYDDEDDDYMKDTTMTSIKAICSLHIDGSIWIWTLLPTPTSSNVSTISKMKLFPLKVQLLRTNNNDTSTMHWTSSMSQLYDQLKTQTILSDSKNNDGINDDDGFESKICFCGTLFEKESLGKCGLIGLYIQITPEQQFFTTYSFQQSKSDKINTNIHDLVLPCNVHSMVDMAFTTVSIYDNVQDGCQLNVLYNCTMSSKISSSILSDYDMIIPVDGSSMKAIQLAIYQPLTGSNSENSIEPVFVGGCDGSKKNSNLTIDLLRLKTREDIILQSHILMENARMQFKDNSGSNNINDNGIDDDDDSLEEILSSIDAMYMKQIFRPYPGKNICCPTSIRCAINRIASTLSTLNDDFDIYMIPPGSNEMNMIQLMKKWASCCLSKNNMNNVDNDMDVDMSPPCMIGEEMDTDNNGNVLDEEGNVRLSKEFKVIEHHKRWMTMLLAIVDEDAKLQRPISFTIMTSSNGCNNGGVVLRAGCTTNLYISKSSDSKSTSNGLGRLDELGEELFFDFQQNESNRELLVDFEIKIREVISQAKLIHKEEAVQIDQLIDMLSKAIDDNSMKSISAIVDDILGDVDAEEIGQWLSSPLSLTDTSSSLLEPRLTISLKDSRKQAQSSTIVPLAAKMVSQYLDRVYSLCLARCILVAAISSSDVHSAFGMNEVTIATCTFLHTAALAWLHSQVTTNPSSDTRKEGSKVPPILAFSPVSKKARTEGAHTKCQQMILQYGLQRHYLNTGTLTSCKNPVEEIIALSKVYVESLLQSNTKIPAFVKELSNGARLSLRLLSPFTAYKQSGESRDLDSSFMVHSILAEVNGLASSNCLSEEKAKMLLKHASTILYKTCVNLSVSPKKADADTFVSVLRSLPDGWISSTSVSSDQYHIDTLSELLNQVLQKHTSEVFAEDIEHLSNMDTIKKLMLPWIVVAQQQRKEVNELIISSLEKSVSDPERVLEHSLLVLLRISKMMRLMAMFESQVATSTNKMLNACHSHTLLSIISNTIIEIENHFSPEIYEVMTEYVALWSSAFRHAVTAQQWNEAFKACLSNPIEDRRVKNFQRLVLAMVEVGEINKLLNNILFTVVDLKISQSNDNSNQSGNVIDLYELASEALVQAASEHSSIGITHSNILSKPKVNYAGCVYTIHACHNEWRRCCQIMDFYGILSQANLMASQEFTLSTEDRKECDLKCINDSVLSSVASSQLIHLVPHKDGRYIVSGELCSDATPPPFRESNTTKNPSVTNMMPNIMNNSLERHSRLLTETGLSSRAIRSMALKTLFKDALSPESLSAIIHSSDRQLMEALSRLGYYSHVIAIANCKKSGKSGACPGGRDIVADAIGHMICQFILPNAVKSLRSIPSDEWISESDGVEHRPTLNQLRLEIGDSPLVSNCDIWRSDGKNKEIEKGSIAFDLVRKFTIAYSNRHNSLALEIAQTLLDLDSCHAKLPLWLHNLITGKSDVNQCIGGLFGQKNTGDPSALVRIYIKNGLLLDACEVLVEALKGDGAKRAEEATKCLPEKGNIEIVPYALIDTLWNTIDLHLKSEDCDPEMRDQLLHGRRRLEEALEFHFKLLKVSEMGILSARALKQ